MERKYLELVEGSFTQEHFDKQAIENKPYVAYSVKDKGVIYTIVPKEDGTMYTIYKVVSKDISNCTYNMIDLGLPSGLKWADRNVGASSPEYYGSYFQWGDTNAYTFDGVGEVTADELASLLQPMVGDEMEVTKDNVGDVLLMMFEGYDVGTDLINTPVGTLVFSLDKLFNWNSYFDTIDGGSTFSKYNNYGGLTVLESSDDAATVHMGSQYRMPTVDELWELKNNTTPTFIDLDGNEYSQEQTQYGAIEQGKLKGIRFTGSNGNSIFLPASGFYEEGSWLVDLTASGMLWSSSLYSSDSEFAKCLKFMYDGSVDDNHSGYHRYRGLSVRGVQP